MGNILRTCKSRTMISKYPVVVVLGCTGTGKSKLAIELAKKFNGEIISADSMQVYNGLDIITNKVTPDEQKEAVHHCINCVDPLSRYTVVDFRNQALGIMDRLIKEKKLPIIVGGTNYYIESLLWEVLINNKEKPNRLLFDVDKDHRNDVATELSDSNLSSQNILEHKITADSFKDIPGKVLHQCLKEIDPAMANALHPEDRRKIIRSLQVYQQHGQRHSEILQQQRSQNGGSSLGGPLRFQKAVMLWLQCDMEVLKKRLDDRVDDMLERGLVNELLDFHKSYNEKRIDLEKPDYKDGIFQSIGFKEFHDYLILPVEEKNSPNGKKIFEKAVEDMKLVTRQYARKQTKWIVNRFLRKPDRQLPPVYGLQATDLNLWEETALLPAVEIVQSILKDVVPSQSPLPIADPINDVAESHFCEICDKILVGRRTWEIHMNSKKHHKRKLKLMKLQNLKEKAFQAEC